LIYLFGSGRGAALPFINSHRTAELNNKLAAVGGAKPNPIQSSKTKMK